MLGPLSIVWLLSPLRRVLGTFSFWLGALFSAVICLLYYFLRESYQPGYIAITWFSEYLRMFENVMPWHEHPFSFYFKNFHQLKFYTPWIFALLLSIGFILLLLKRNISQQHALRWTILSLGYLLIISLPAVKLEWYDSPVYPFFALILGVTAGYFTQKLPVSLRLILLLPIAFILFRKMSFISHNTLPREPLEYEGYMLRESKSNNAIKVFMPVETSEHRLQLDFYKKLREMETGQSIEVLDSTSQIETGDELVINHPHLSGVNQQFEVDTLQYWEKYGALIKVAGKK